MNNSNQFIKFIGNNIRYYRKKRGFSQEKLAVRAHLSSEYISRVERGRKNICAETIFKISKALNTDPHLFFSPRKENE